MELWRKTQHLTDSYLPLPPLSFNQMQTQILGLPMLDTRSILLAFAGETPVGYVHTIFAPSENGYTFDYTTGQICFLCVDPKYHGAFDAAVALIRAGEDYLTGLGATRIFGGSPSPSAPFYTGYYGGGEAIGFFQSDKIVVDAFFAAGYQIHQNTVWFHRNLRDSLPTPTVETLGYDAEYNVVVGEIPNAKTWWEGCTFSNGMWLDATAHSLTAKRPVARLRTRITYPDTDGVSVTMYGKTWLASLMELRVHPDYAEEKLQSYFLGKLLRYLLSYNQIVQIEAHAAEDTTLFSLLRCQCWIERGHGYMFVKDV